MRLVLVSALLSAVTLTAEQSAPAPPITGRVITPDTDSGIPNVRITAGTNQDERTVLTDLDGRFTLPAPPGRYSVFAEKSGYARQEVDAPAPGKTIEIRLRRAAAIAGRILNDLGDPIIGAQVQIEIPPDGKRGLRLISRTQSDDLGEYRLGNLPAGRYAIRVTTMRNLTTFYPGVTEERDAAEIAVDFGEERSPLDVMIPTGRSANQPFSASAVLAMPNLIRLAPGSSLGVDRKDGRIRGRILGKDGVGLAYAQVVLLSEGRPPSSRTIHAGADGRFELVNLAGARYRLGASKPGYFPANVAGASANGAITIELAADETRDDVEIGLTRWSALTGTVVDEHGDPLHGASVQLLQIRYEAGRRRLVPAGRQFLTDDRGMYRVFALTPGNYIVSASMNQATSANVPGYTRTYFPGTAVPAAAQFVSVGPGQEVLGIGITMSQAPTFRVSGTILDSGGAPSTGGSVQMFASQRSSAAASVPAGARTSADGGFEFINVDPGQYVIHVYRGRENQSTEGEFGAVAVTVVDSDVTNLVVHQSLGSTINGRIVFDSTFGGKLPDPSANELFELSPIPVDVDRSPYPPYASADIARGWHFSIAGINGPRRLQVTRTPPGWTLKEILANGIDITDQALAFGRAEQSLSGVDVVFTNRISVLSGTIQDRDNRRVPDSHLIVFSTDRDRWYMASRFVRTAFAPDGTFAIEGLPSGSYYVVAVAQLQPDGADAWQDPEFLESLIPQASSATIRDGDQTTVDVRVR